MREIEDREFQTEVREAELPTVVAFTGSWCQPCQAMKPELEHLAEQMKGDIQFVQMDVQSASRTASDLGVRSVPTLVLVNEGMVRDTLVGSQTKLAVRQWINDAV